MKAAALAAVLFFSLASARHASAVCTATDVMQCGANCWHCSGNTCTIAKLLTVSPPTAGAPCTFDFGSRDIVLASGGFTSVSNPFEIRAHGVTVGSTGTLKATGNQLTPGGIITITVGGGGFTLLKSANAVDVTGAEGPPGQPGGGGSFLVQSDGDVVLGGTIVADGTTPNANGGTITVTAGRLSGTTVVSSGNVTVTGAISSGGKANGFGGTVSLTANGASGSGKVDVENKITAVGGIAGGTISVQGTGDVILGTNPNGGALLVADANGNAGCGGSIDVLAGGKVDGNGGVTGPLSAQGSNALLASDGGGAGGMISIEAQHGNVNLGGGNAGGVAADGGLDGCGGSVCINTDAPGTAITTAVAISANASGSMSFGGCIQLCSSGAALVHDDIDASAGGCGGDAEVDSLQGLTVEPPAQAVHADATTGSGGCVTLSAGGPTTVSSGVVLNAATPSLLAGNSGGEVDVLGNTSVMVNSAVDVSASGPNYGGTIDIEAGSDLTVGSTATLNADGGRTGGAGGSLTMIAGVPDLPGTLVLSGNAHALGTSTAGFPATADVSGCSVQIGSSAVLDTTGDPQAANFLVARSSLSTATGATIRTTGSDPKSRNFVTLPAGSPVPGGPAFSPPLVPSDLTFAPLCTGPNTPANCLLPCPVCGNSRTEFPETCDDGPANGPCNPCGPTCRTTPSCDDHDPCTTDTCDPIAGCLHALIANCTTTTTTLATTTSTSSTVTTSTSTTTTTVTTTTSSTTPSTTSTTSAVPTTSTTATVPTTSTTATVTTSTSTVTTVTTSSSSSSTTSTTTTTTTTSTIPSTCAPSGCDDGDPCTADSCVAGRCRHDPLTGFDGVICQLDAMDSTLRTAPSAAVGGSGPQARFEHVIARARRLTVAGRTATGHARAKRLEDARGQLVDFSRAVRVGDRRGKIDPELASKLVAQTQAIATELSSLRASGGTPAS